MLTDCIRGTCNRLSLAAECCTCNSSHSLNKKLEKYFHRFLSCPIFRATLNHPQICAMNVQKPPVQCGPYLTPLLFATFNVALLSRAAWLSAFALCFANTAVVSRQKTR